MMFKDEYKWVVNDNVANITITYTKMDVKQMHIENFKLIIDSNIQVDEVEKKVIIKQDILTPDLHNILFKRNRCDIIQWLHSKTILKGNKHMWSKYAAIYGHKKY